MFLHVEDLSSEENAASQRRCADAMQGDGNRGESIRAYCSGEMRTTDGEDQQRHALEGRKIGPVSRDEEQPIEGAFLACTLWLADAHVLSGNQDRAQVLFDRVVAIANDLGLLAEEYDSAAHRQLGNFPQALTHIALINTAHNLDDARKASEKPAMQRSQ